MRIEEIHKITSELVVMDDSSEYTDYMRYSPDNWQVRMGESWESVYLGVEKLEAMYQQYKKQ